jgi:hypothetical protein
MSSGAARRPESLLANDGRETIYHEGSDNHHGEDEERLERRSRVSFSADRCENQGAERLAGRDARSATKSHQAARSRRGRGVEVERGSGVDARRNHLDRGDVQECGEDDLCQGRLLEDPSGLFNSSLEGNTRRAIDFHEADASVPWRGEGPSGALPRSRASHRFSLARLAWLHPGIYKIYTTCILRS